MSRRHLLFRFSPAMFVCQDCGARQLYLPPLYFVTWLEDFRRFAREHVKCARKEETEAAA